MNKKSRLKSLWNISARELKRWIQNPLYIFCMVVGPVFCTVFFLSIMHKGLPSELPAAVVDLDRTPASRALARQLDAFPQSKVKYEYADFRQARQAVQQGKIYGFIYIPEGFSRDAVSGRRPELSFYTNGSYLVAATLLYRDMKTLSVLANAKVGLELDLAHGQTQAHAMAKLQPIVIDAHPLGNPWINYSVYLNNTILLGVLQLMILLVTVFSIGSEIKYRTAGKWLSMSQDSLFGALAGKLLPQTLLFFLVGLFMQSCMYGFMGFPLQSGLMPMIFALLLLILAAQAAGVFMISILPTLRLGLSFASLFGMLSFSIVGFTFPVSAMHPILQVLSDFFPLRHYFLIYVDQALNGRDFFYSLAQYSFLAVFLLLPILTSKILKNALRNFRYIP